MSAEAREARVDERMEEIRGAFDDTHDPVEVVKGLIYQMRPKQDGGERTGSVSVFSGRDRNNGYAAAMEIVLDRLQAAEERVEELRRRDVAWAQAVAQEDPEVGERICSAQLAARKALREEEG